MPKYYDKTTLNEYSNIRNQILKDMGKYARGELKGEELNKFKALNNKANELQRDLDRQYMSERHKKDDSFWDKWSRIHD